ncbi:MAG: PAAR domain-containing protein [Gammaproteobacteria bacterium]
MNWLLKGLMAGIAVAAIGVAVVGTGGLAAVAVVGGAAALGAGLGEAMSAMSWAPKELTGAITATGSANVFTNGLPAARAHVDSVSCSKHGGAPVPIASGSANVFINGVPAARVDDKTGCSASITKGSGNVFIGRGTVATDPISPENLVPGWLHATLTVVGVASAIVLAGPVIAIGGLAGGLVGGYGGGWLGGKVFGEGSDGQKWSSLGGSLVGGLLGAKVAPGAWRFAQRVEIGVKPGTLGVNGANMRVGLKPLRPVEPPAPPKVSPGEALRTKYANMTREQRAARMEELAEANAHRRLQEMESSIPHAHFVQKHGAQTTLASQLERAQFGKNPSTGVVETYPNGNPKIPSSATRFMSHRDQLNAINRAEHIYRTTGDQTLAERPIRFDYVVGEGYKKVTLAYGRSYSAQVWFRNGQVTTAFPIYGH